MSGITKTDTLKTIYREVLIGFERYSFTEEQVRLNEGDFESALNDLQACKECDGEICRTTVNYRCKRPHRHYENRHRCGDECYPGTDRAYIALYHAGCAVNNAPVFAVHRCPGVTERKKMILDAITARPWWDK